jgi:dihydroorotase
MPESTPKYDLILRGGWVIDPANGRDGPMDVAISGGKIGAVDRRIEGATAKKDLDVAGLYVTPGLIDLHAHFYGGGGGYKDFEMNPDMYGLPNGTTTVVDAGGAGWLNYGGFIDHVVHGFKVRVLGLLNICAHGMHTHHENDPKSLMPEECARTIRENRSVFVGIKTAHYMQPGYESVDAAVKAGDIAGVPVMMDSWPTDVRRYPDMILKHLRPGDIHTHFYAQHFPWLEKTPLPLAGGGRGWGYKIAPYMWEARKRGVIFDVGHGGGSFWFRIAGPAMAQGFGPDTISTDAHSGSFYMPRATMPVTISKLLCLGMPLQEAIDRSTRVPAKVISRADLGTLTVGAEADVAVFELERAASAESGFGYVDSGGARMKGDKRLTCAMTIRAGQVLFDRDGLSCPDYRGLGDYKRVD